MYKMNSGDLELSKVHFTKEYVVGYKYGAVQGIDKEISSTEAEGLTKRIAEFPSFGPNDNWKSLQQYEAVDRDELQKYEDSYKAYKEWNEYSETNGWDWYLRKITYFSPMYWFIQLTTSNVELAKRLSFVHGWKGSANNVSVFAEPMKFLGLASFSENVSKSYVSSFNVDVKNSVAVVKCFASVAVKTSRNTMYVKSVGQTINALIKPEKFTDINPAFCDKLSSDGQCGPIVDKVCPSGACGNFHKCVPPFFNKGR